MPKLPPGKHRLTPSRAMRKLQSLPFSVSNHSPVDEIGSAAPPSSATYTDFLRRVPEMKVAPPTPPSGRSKGRNSKLAVTSPSVSRVVAQDIKRRRRNGPTAAEVRSFIARGCSRLETVPSTLTSELNPCVR